MDNYNVYEDMANRTNGDIYVGVVGPVRTGKSTFIKRFMETLVIPYAPDEQRARMRDSLPQPAEGKTVMTTEPKFVPESATKIQIRGGAEASVRLVDCVGFPVAGANGFEEDGKPRLIKTPWSEEPVEFERAASIGTEKVISEHSTIAILVTTDGSVCNLPRSSYEPAEAIAVKKLKEAGKPFVVLLNAVNPEACFPLKEELEMKYGVPVLPVNVEKMTDAEILSVLQKVLFEFPLLELNISLPEWIRALPETSGIVSFAIGKIKEASSSLTKMRDALVLESLFSEGDAFKNPNEVSMDLGKGKAEVFLEAREGLFYEVVSKECGVEIRDNLDLIRFVKELSDSRQKYERIGKAFDSAKEYGYATVSPDEKEMVLEEPKLVKKGSGYGVHFKASAPSYHLIRVDVSGSVTPVVGSQKQGEDFLHETLEDFGDGTGKIWETNIFGKSLKEILSNGLERKTDGMPVEVKKKMRRTIGRIVNEGKGGVICILL